MKYAVHVRILVRFFLAMIVPAYSSPALASEQPIGRLFSSPRERIVLDQARQIGSKNRVETNNAPNGDQLGDQITLDGFVRKNNGKTTVWINQMPQHGHENPQGITIVQSGRNPSAVSVQLPSGKSVNLKAGQTFDATNGKVSDVYDNAIPVVPKTPAK